MKAPRVTGLPKLRFGDWRPRMPAGMRVVWESRTVRFRSGEPAGFRHNDCRFAASAFYLHILEADLSEQARACSRVGRSAGACNEARAVAQPHHTKDAVRAQAEDRKS